jgi:hypothetical protein
MMLEPLVIFELAMLGLFTGFMAGLLGIGGGMIMVPFLTMVLSARNIPDDLGLKMAIATAMSTIIFTSISSVRAHHQKGAVRWLLVRALAPGLVLGSMLSSFWVTFSLCLWRSPPPRCFWTASPSPRANCPARWACWAPVVSLAFCLAWWALAALLSVCPSWPGAMC